MIQLHEDSLSALSDQIEFCVANLTHPACTLEHAGRFYEQAAETLRGFAILQLLIHADRRGFSSNLVASGQARRAFLRRCARKGYADHYLAFSRSGSMLDAAAGDDFALAAEVLRMSPASLRRGDEYEDDFWWQRLIGLLIAGAPAPEVAAALSALEGAAEGEGARIAVARALVARDAKAFAEAVESLLGERSAEVEDDDATDEDPVAAADAHVFIEGIAVLKLARRLGIAIGSEYPMCPTLALLPGKPAAPADEFATP